MDKDNRCCANCGRLDVGIVGCGEHARTCMQDGDAYSNWIPAVLANETKAGYMSEEEALKDRKLFVHNLGILLSQTREGIISAELDDDEIVTVTFKNGATKYINVNMDSYMAIIRDVSKRVG